MFHKVATNLILLIIFIYSFVFLILFLMDVENHKSIITASFLTLGQNFKTLIKKINNAERNNVNKKPFSFKDFQQK